MNKPLNIVHVFGNAHAGDWAFYPLKMWHEAGHRVAVICPVGGPLVDRLQSAGIPVYVIPFPSRLRHLREAWACIGQLRRAFRQLEADVAHFHLVPANLWGRIAAWLARTPVRVTQWPGPLPLESTIPRVIELSTVWMDTAIIASSTSMQRFFQKYRHTSGKIHLIYYGFPLDRFDPRIDGRKIREEFQIGPETRLVTMIAYMYPPVSGKVYGGIGVKGHEVLIQAAQQIIAAGHDVRFLLVGDELIPGTARVYKPMLHQMVKDLGLEERVIFAGRRHDIPEILAATDVAAVPSVSENVGGAVEPLLMEKPVVASNVGGLPDVVIDGQTGYLVPPGDPQALAQALLGVLALPIAERQAMGQRGRAIVQSLFDINLTAQQQESLYYQLLSKLRGFSNRR